MAVGILLLRLAVGLTVAAHGAQKLFGWFGGQGLEGTAASFEPVGLRPGKLHAIVAGLAEAVGGTLIATGLLTPLGGAAVVGVMAVAIAVVHLRHGFFAQSGGIEYPLLLAVAATAVGYAGPGTYSLDHVIGWSLSGTAWGSGALALGLMAAGAVALACGARADRSRRGATVRIRRHRSQRMAA